MSVKKRGFVGGARRLGFVNACKGPRIWAGLTHYDAASHTKSLILVKNGQQSSTIRVYIFYSILFVFSNDRSLVVHLRISHILYRLFPIMVGGVDGPFEVVPVPDRPSRLNFLYCRDHEKGARGERWTSQLLFGYRYKMKRVLCTRSTDLIQLYNRSYTEVSTHVVGGDHHGLSNLSCHFVLTSDDEPYDEPF